MSHSKRAYSAARWTTASTVARAALQLFQIAVLARFLSPEDYGLMAMVLVVQSYANLFSDMGLSTAFVQRQQISHEERSSLYWLSVAVGGALMLIVMALSPLVAIFFNEPQLVPLMLLVATNFLVISLGQQLRMDAEKSLNFRPVAIIEISVAVVGFLFAVVTAWNGLGVYALVIAAMATAWLTMILCWMILAQGWRPALRMRWCEVRWFVRFGGGMVLNNLINHINSTIDLILGGRLLGPASLGLYSIPRNLLMQIQGMVNPIFTRVGFPLIASIQHDNDRVKQVYLKTMNMTASVNAPIYVAMFLFSAEIILLLLGDKWADSSPLLQILSIWGLLRSFGNPTGVLLFGLGRVRLAVKWNFAMLVIVPPVLYYCSQWGTLGMASGLSVLMLVGFIPGWYFLVYSTCGAGLREYFKQVALPTICAIIAGLMGWTAVYYFQTPFTRLFVGLTIAGFLYLTISSLWNREFCKVIKHAIAGNKRQAFCGADHI